MNPKLRLILLNYPKKSGFALPAPMILELVILLVGIERVVRSQSDRSKAMAQKDTAVGLNVIEVALERYEELIYANKYLAIYEDCINNPDAHADFCNEDPTTHDPYEAKHTNLEFPELSTPSIFAPDLGTLKRANHTFPRVGDSPTSQKTMTIDEQTIQVNDWKRQEVE